MQIKYIKVFRTSRYVLAI